MSQSSESTSRTLITALVMCVVCSAIVATAAVLLKPQQTKAKENDRSINILQIAGLYQSGIPVDEQMKQVTARVINFDSGKFTDEMTVAQVIDPKKLSRYPDKITVLDQEKDPAKVIRRENFGVVYVVEKDGKLDRIILPIRGYGLWSTLWGFVALEPDLNTVIGLGYYQHAETPGLGGEVDNPKWKALWPGKKIYASSVDGATGASTGWELHHTEDSSVAIEIVKGLANPTDPEFVHKVDGLSGATLTSKGVHHMLHFWMSDMGYGKFLKNLKAGEA